MYAEYAEYKATSLYFTAFAYVRTLHSSEVGSRKQTLRVTSSSRVVMSLHHLVWSDNSSMFMRSFADNSGMFMRSFAAFHKARCRQITAAAGTGRPYQHQEHGLWLASNSKNKKIIFVQCNYLDMIPATSYDNTTNATTAVQTPRACPRRRLHCIMRYLLQQQSTNATTAVLT